MDNLSTRLSRRSSRGKSLHRIPLQRIADVSNAVEEKTTSLLPAFKSDRRKIASFHQLEPSPTCPDDETASSSSQIEQEVTHPLTVVIPERGNHIQVSLSSGRQQQEIGSASDNDNDNDAYIDKQNTLPMMVLKELAQQQGQPPLAMKSEVTGAAGAAGAVGVGNLSASALKYIGNLMIQRGFGAGPYGLYSLGMSLVILVLSLFTFGLDSAMVRYIAIYRGKHQPRLLQGITLFATAVAGVTGITGTIFIFYVAPYFANYRHSPDVLPVLQVLAPLVPLLTLQAIWTGGLQGFKNFKKLIIAQRVLPALALIVFLGAALLFYHNIIGVVIATLLSTLLGLIVSLYYLFRNLSKVTTMEREEYQIGEWLNFAVPNFLSSIVDIVLQSVDTLMLAFYSISFAEIGLYTAALKINTFISIPLSSLNTIFSPTIAELYSKGEHEKLLVMFKLITKWSITLSLPIFIIATLFSEVLLSLSGSSFLSAGPLLVALSISSLANISTGSVGLILLMTGYQKYSFYNSVTAVVVNVVLGIILTPHYGAMGVAISTGVAFAVVNVIRLFQVYILLKMQPYSLDTLKPVSAGLISASVSGALLFLTNHLNVFLQSERLQLSIELLLIPAFLAMYIGLLALFKLGPEDKIVVDALGKKFGRRKQKKGI